MQKEEIKKALQEASGQIDEEEIALNNIKAEEEKTINEWKNTKIENGIDIEELKIMKELLLVSILGESPATIITGEGGISKTFTTLETIKENLKPEDYDYKCGFITSLSLYKYLYHSRNKKCVILDDLENLFKDDKAITILKNALWDIGNKKRIIQYDSTSERLDVPSIFEIKSKLIILCNRIPNINDKQISALIGRAIHYELKLSYFQKLKIIKKILENRNDLNQEDKIFIYDLIYKKTNEAILNFNFRTLEKLIYFYKYDPEKAGKLFEETIEEDYDKKVVIELLGKGSVEHQIQQFMEKTNKSRATYFRIKKSINIS